MHVRIQGRAKTVRIYVDLANRDVALHHKKYPPIDQMAYFQANIGRL